MLILEYLISLWRWKKINQDYTFKQFKWTCEFLRILVTIQYIMLCCGRTRILWHFRYTIVFAAFCVSLLILFSTSHNSSPPILMENPLMVQHQVLYVYVTHHLIVYMNEANSWVDVIRVLFINLVANMCLLYFD